MKKINWTKPAKQDLDDIEDYISQNNQFSAAKVILAILYKVNEKLPRFPAIGKAGRIMGSREFFIPNLPYIVVYRVVGDYVEILRVIHSSRKWPKS